MFDFVGPIDHPTSTKGVVIMYGWMGSIQKHVRKYAELYVKRGWAVVYGTIDVVPTALRDQSVLGKVATESVVKAAEAVREVEKDTGSNVPVILHYFSNGGAFAAEMLDILIKEAKETDTEKSSAIDPAVKQDMLLISERLYEKGYEIIDSAPAYLHDRTVYDALDTAMPQAHLRIATKVLIFMFYIVRDIVRAIQGKEHVAIEFWKNTIDSDLCLRQIFIYSVKDSITDHTKIDELIEERKKIKPGVQIISSKFEDSGHVMHLRRYPKEYMEILDQVVNSCQS